MLDIGYVPSPQGDGGAGVDEKILVFQPTRHLYRYRKALTTVPVTVSIDPSLHLCRDALGEVAATGNDALRVPGHYSPPPTPAVVL